MGKLTVIGTCLVLATQGVYANCNSIREAVFSCPTAKGRRIEVCDLGQTIRYSFGKPKAKPEISVSVPKAKATGLSCYTCGRYVTHSIDFPNGDTIYRVSWSADRLSEAGTIGGGVEVIIGAESKAVVWCNSEPAVGDLGGIKFSVE